MTRVEIDADSRNVSGFIQTKTVFGKSARVYRSRFSVRAIPTIIVARIVFRLLRPNELFVGRLLNALTLATGDRFS